MEKVEYDMDTSGGLMEEIQALIAPPISEELKKKQARNERESTKRFGNRTVNRDCCDSCSEGGDLLCCDRCPASFHFNCCDPPLEEDDIPTGEWICNECRAAMKHETVTCGIISQTNSACPSPSSETGSMSFSQISPLNPFAKLTETFKNKNPKEFSLPPDLESFTVFPGDRKRKCDEKIQNSKNGNSGRREDEQIPDRFCFQCSRLSDFSDLVFCDFCPLAFHPDCLNPPLAMQPASLWLCPCHAEHFEPELEDARYSRRSQIIEDIRGVVSQHAVKMNFISKTKKTRILNNRKSNQLSRRLTVVPESIKSQYRHPPALDVPNFICEMQKTLSEHHRPIGLPSQPDKDEWLKFIVQLHCDIASDLCKPPQSTSDSQPKHSSNSGELIKTDGIATDAQTSITKPKDFSTDQIEISHKNNAVTSVEQLPSSAVNVSTTSSVTMPGISKNLPTSSNPKIIILATQTPSSVSKTAALTSTSAISSDNKPVLAVGSKIVGAPSSLGKPTTPTSTPGSSSSSHIVNSVTTDTLQDPTLSQLDDRLVRVLAFQRLQQLLGQTKAPSENPIQALQPVSTARNQAVKQSLLDLSNNDDCAIAVLSPMVGSSKPCRMINKSVTIGSGIDNDICLTNAGHCNFITGKHACIFFDLDTRQFELLNYSEHGTVVDNVLYSCDFSALKSTGSNEVVSSNAKFPSTSSSFYEVKRRKKRSLKDRSTRGLGITDTSLNPCRCRSSGSSVIGGTGAGWEGTAVLHHGSYLKFGCLHFVFSIVDCATQRPPKVTIAPTKITSPREISSK